MRKKLVSILIAVASFLCACSLSDSSPSSSGPMVVEQTIQQYIHSIEQENPENLKLTIYYLPYYVYTPIPLTTDALIKNPSTIIVVLCGDEMDDVIQKLKAEGDTVQLVPVTDASRQIATLYYVLEANGEPLLDVSIYDVYREENNTIFVNKVEYEFNEWFYHLVEPYIPEYEYSPPDAENTD